MQLETHLETKADIKKTMQSQGNKAKGNIRKEVDIKTKTRVNNIKELKLIQYSDYNDYAELESYLETEAEVGQTMQGQENKAKSNMKKQVNNKTKTGFDNVKELKLTQFSDYIH